MISIQKDIKLVAICNLSTRFLQILHTGIFKKHVLSFHFFSLFFFVKYSSF